MKTALNRYLLGTLFSRFLASASAKSHYSLSVIFRDKLYRVQ
uniref:Uncharacterized protein n=1 Tax=Arundo donax TaxID=35708 RepID=A0A0A8ZVE2_ARUDO